MVFVGRQWNQSIVNSSFFKKKQNMEICSLFVLFIECQIVCKPGSVPVLVVTIHLEHLLPNASSDLPE